MRLNAETRGSGPDLVLVHGWGMNGTVWHPLAESLAGSFRVTLLDLPGHGGSAFDPERRALADWADACLAAAPERAVWIGWSLGGAVALEAALGAAGRVRALLQVTATPRFLRAADWPHAMPADTLERFHGELTADPAATLDRFLALQVQGDEAARHLLRELRRRLRERPVPDPAALDAGLDLLQSTDLRERIGALRCPSLWLYGDRDTLVPARGAGSLAGLLPGARVEVVKGSAHAPFLSHAAEFAALAVPFLERSHEP